jgi:TPR repeat protein
MMNKIKLVLVFFMGISSLNALELSKEINTQIEDCQKGNVLTCYEVGIVLTTGKNAEDQEKKDLGLEYVRRACKYGEVKACDYLGENYFKDGHFLEAKPLYEDACKRGIVDACLGLGTIYRDGHDVRQDDVISREYYEKGCELGSKDACLNVAIIYRGGFGVKQDRSMVKKYYKKACDAGSEPGCNSFKKLDNEDKGIEEPGLWEWFKSLFN